SMHNLFYSNLKKNYCDQAVKCTQTGNGVALNVEGHSNLLHEIPFNFLIFSDCLQRLSKRSFHGTLTFMASGRESPCIP
ncbi:hypothetical protein PAXRUDRAFT_157611, partial [Paxillus rubicundulus Ve08.2h10]